MKRIDHKEAHRWHEAYPIGNGRMGAMIYSGIMNEKIELTEETFFSGEPPYEDMSMKKNNFFLQMRQLIQEGMYDEAKKLCGKLIGRKGNYGTNLPVGTILISFQYDCVKEPAQSMASSYLRELNLEYGIISSSFRYNDCKIQTNSFASHKYNLIVYRIEAERAILNGEIHFISERETDTISSISKQIRFQCQALETIHSDGLHGVCLNGIILAKCDGILHEEKQGLSFEYASVLTLYIQMKTDFSTQEDVLPTLLTIPSYQCILDEHKQDMSQLFNRVSLQIKGPNEHAVQQIPFLFQMGRYLLYSSCREDSKLPAHLQGIWNDHVACSLGWTCDMHLDINTQMNYWPAEVTNLSETTTSLFHWLINALIPNGRRSALNVYGYTGWTAELVSNAWGYSDPYWSATLAPCPTGGIWALDQMWEHFSFQNDINFLRETLFPILEEAVLFFTQYVWENEDGYVSCGPSISPENSFLVEGKTYEISNGCTYEIIMIRRLFENYITACDVLHIENCQLAKIRIMLPKLLPYRLTTDGQITEWNHDYSSVDKQHRHTSHLLGVFPYNQITPENETLANAVHKTLQAKVTPQNQWEDTGWARSLLILYSARLQKPDDAYNHICCMLESLLETNGFIMHPPTRGTLAKDPVYELDGNTGLTSAIAEMLLQSNNGRIQLLPCLPRQWGSGRVTGLKARGNIFVSIEWSTTICQTNLYSVYEQNITVCYQDNEQEVHLFPNKNIQICFDVHHEEVK